MAGQSHENRSDVRTQPDIQHVFSGFEEDGSILRLEAAYDFGDGLKLTGGILTYQDGDIPSWPILMIAPSPILPVDYPGVHLGLVR